MERELNTLHEPAIRLCTLVQMPFHQLYLELGLEDIHRLVAAAVAVAGDTDLEQRRHTAVEAVAGVHIVVDCSKPAAAVAAVFEARVVVVSCPF